MVIVQINSVPNGSTGSIMFNIHNTLLKEGIESYVVWGRGREAKNTNEIFMNDKLGVYFHKIYTIFTDKTGFASINSTKRLLKKLDKVKPDIIHLHNIHGYYINIELLFNYIKKNNIKVIWTLHDCWSFTGHCAHFLFSKCEKWKNKCFACPSYKEYPKSFIDNSKNNFMRKKEIFTGVSDLTIVTPSKWLANLVEKSFLNQYDIKVINNGIDTNIFKKIDSKKLEFRKKYSLESKKIILGVAAQFSSKKGFNDFIKLSQIIEEDFVIVLVGLSKKQIKKLPNNVIGLKKTSDVYELVDIYNSADVFLNLTYSDNYPTVNLEAIACGTPVITYDTGGSMEFLNFISSDSKDDHIVKKEDALKDMSVVYEKIKKVILNDNFDFKDTFLIDKQEMIKKYINLYKKDNYNGV